MSGKMIIFGMPAVKKEETPQPEVKVEEVKEQKPEIKTVVPPPVTNVKFKYFIIPLRGEPVQATREEVVLQLLDGVIHRVEVRGPNKKATVDHIYCDSMPPFHVFNERSWEKGSYRSSEDAMAIAERNAA